MKSRILILSSLVVANIAFAGSATAQGQPIATSAQNEWYIVLYDQTTFRGNPANFSASTHRPPAA